MQNPAAREREVGLAVATTEPSLVDVGAPLWMVRRAIDPYSRPVDTIGVMTLRHAHAGRTPADVDWAAWSVALTTASLVAPAEVARAIDGFGRAIQHFLDTLGDRDPVRNPLHIDEVG